MRKADRVLREYFRNEVERVEKNGRTVRSTSADRTDRAAAWWSELLCYAALAAIVLLPHVVKLPPPQLAEKSSVVYRQYVQQPSVFREQAQAYMNSLEQWFREE
ncbi:MAG: hypothetical protein R6V86_09415 [Spirochaetia bacterium]